MVRLSACFGTQIFIKLLLIYFSFSFYEDSSYDKRCFFQELKNMTKKLSRRKFINQTVLASSNLVLFSCTNQRANEDVVQSAAKTNILDSNSIHSDSLSPYSEAPMLSRLVERGELPPVQERLPKVPFIRQAETIGNYGGTLYNDAETQGGRFFLDGALVSSPQETNNVGSIIQPHMCEKVEINENYSEFTFYIREGLKWSDGLDVTADDVLWWWDHEQNNKDLYPEGPRTAWKIGESYAEFEKISKWVFKIRFPQSFRPLMNVSAHEWMSFSNFFAQPAHYMKQFHIDFNPRANEIAKSYGYQVWYQLYKEREEYMRPHAGKPGLGPWVRVATETTHDIFERNPFYAEVDQEGNQLPYIDRIYMSVVEDRKLRDARVATGGVSIGIVTALSQINIYQKNMEQGDFHINKWKYSNSSECMFAFNLNHKDPVLKKIYNDLRFRKAMSVAINRKKINDSLYFGLAKECQATINPDTSYFDPEWLHYYAEHDIGKANALLDDMGLIWDDKHAYRLRPDGKRLKTVILYHQQNFPLQIIELVRNDWSQTGMDVILRQSDQQFRKQSCMSGDHDCTCWNADLTEEIAAYLPWMTKWSPNNALYYAMDWWYWYYSDGKIGRNHPNIGKISLTEWPDGMKRKVKKNINDLAMKCGISSARK